MFDFSRAGTPGDGSSRRRARDRSARRGLEVAKQGPPPIRPLTINPLRPSGPIRRTCGVIKLPVTWIPAAPCEDGVKLCALVKMEEAMEVDQPQPPPSLTSAVPSVAPLVSAAPPMALAAACPPAPVSGGESTQSQPQPTNQPQAQLQPQAQPLLQAQLQAQPQDPPQAQVPPQAQAPPQPQPPVPPKLTSVVMVPALWENRLRGVMVYDYETGNEIKISPEKLQNGLSHSGNVENEEGSLSVEKSTLSALLNKQLLQQAGKIEDKKHLASSLSAGSIVPSLLAHGKNVPRQQGVLSSMVPSLKTIKENGSLIATPQQTSLHGGNIVLTLPTMASASAYKATASLKPVSGVGIGGPAMKTTIVPGSGRAITTTKPGTSSGLYVSDSELRRQEEKVQLIRKQIMAAQSTI